MVHVGQDRQKPKRISGVIVGAALCCLPGATLGSMYDDWRAAKEAPEMERRARARQAALQRERRSAPSTLAPLRRLHSKAVLSFRLPLDSWLSGAPLTCAIKAC